MTELSSFAALTSRMTVGLYRNRSSSTCCWGEPLFAERFG
jgi:hypothetical protein